MSDKLKVAVDYCDCAVYCRRSGVDRAKNLQWFCPYIPEAFGGPHPRCKMIDDHEMQMRPV